jgi:hypothetical protein
MNTLKVTEVLNADSMNAHELEQVLAVKTILDDYGFQALQQNENYYSVLYRDTLIVSSNDDLGVFTPLKVEYVN